MGMDTSNGDPRPNPAWLHFWREIFRLHAELEQKRAGAKPGPRLVRLSDVEPQPNTPYKLDTAQFPRMKDAFSGVYIVYAPNHARYKIGMSKQA